MIPINQEITEAAATLRRETAACFVLRIGVYRDPGKTCLIGP